MSEETKTVFVRKASGLTRVISKWDALAYSFVAPTIAYAAHYIIWCQTFNPGADVYIASLWILSLMPIAGLYVMFSISMPRSGGEYIYVSRVISPAWGLFACWTLTIVGLNWSGVLTTWLINWGFGDTLLAQGVLSGNTALRDLGLYLNQPSTIEAWIIGTLALVVCYFIMARGTRTVVKFTWIIFVWNFIGLAVYGIAALMAGGPMSATVQNNILLYTGHSYTDIINGAVSAATALGQTFPNGATYLLPTLMAGATYLNLSTLGSTFAANIAGEIKEVKAAQTLAQLGSLALFVVYWEIFTFFQYAGFGSVWYQAIAMMDQANASGIVGPGVTGDWLAYYFGFDIAYKLPLATYNVIFTTANPILTGISTIHFAVIDFGGMLTLAFGPVRNLFAWSFDGILPKWVNRVNRRGSPVNSVILGGAIAWIIFTINTWTTWLAYIIHTIAIWMIGWCVFGIAGIIFPWRRKDIFEKSPEVVKKRIAGIPAISILGVVTLGVAAWGAYSALAPPIAALIGGGGGMEQIVGTVAFFVIIPFILYYAAYFINKSKGVPMDLRFKEIPPD